MQVLMQEKGNVYGLNCYSTDKAALELKTFDFARILIYTSNMNLINEAVLIEANGLYFK